MGCHGVRSRHWFTTYGWVGLRSPVCVRCGAPNPKKLTDDELQNYEGFKAHIAEVREERDRLVRGNPRLGAEGMS